MGDTFSVGSNAAALRIRPRKSGLRSSTNRLAHRPTHTVSQQEHRLPRLPLLNPVYEYLQISDVLVKGIYEEPLAVRLPVPAKVRSVDCITATGEPLPHVRIPGAVVLQAMYQDDHGAKLACGPPPMLEKVYAARTGKASLASLYPRGALFF